MAEAAVIAEQCSTPLSLADFLAANNRRCVRKVDEDTVHGVKLDERYRLAKVRYNGRQWVKVWAIHLPARPAVPGLLIEVGKDRYAPDAGAPERLFVMPCSLFPKGGSWGLGQSYFIDVGSAAS